VKSPVTGVEDIRMSSQPNFFPRVMSLAVHELRTPVTVVSGYLRMLLREQGGPITDKQRRMLEEAERSCARIGALVGEMSELGKLEGQDLALAQQDLDLSAVLTDVATAMHEGDNRGIEVEVHGAEQPLIVTGDRTRLAAALKALVHSAVREQSDRGVIVVDSSVLNDGDGAWAVVAVGAPSLIPLLRDGARTMPRVFDEWLGGLGMALPVARRVIEAHGGALWSVDGLQSRAAAALRIPIRT
jgi:signal transduction histidine kinase